MLDLLKQLDQPQLTVGLENLSPSELENFAAQLNKYASFSKQKDLLLQPTKKFPGLSPFPAKDYCGNDANRELGKMLVREGKVGCLILAGGQGTRLGFDGPKGMYPVTPIKGKSLFQLFCERTKAASDRPLPLCILTSPDNHDQTVEFFQQHHHFGLSPSQVFFLQQETLPFLDDRGKWMLEKPGKIAEGPDGNGHALHLFYQSGIWQKWKDAGIEYLNVIFVDNALADPFDFEFVGFSAGKQVDAALKTIERQPHENMGALALDNDKLKVIEYSELPSDTSFTLSSTGMMSINMEFIRELQSHEFPLHLARKKAPVLLCTSKGCVQETASIWKCERFLFDLFDHARTSAVLIYPREKIYAPLKNATGDRSIQTVKDALLLHDYEIYKSLTGLIPPTKTFELDPAFYYPSEELVQKLINLPVAEMDYISG